MDWIGVSFFDMKPSVKQTIRSQIHTAKWKNGESMQSGLIEDVNM